MTVRSKDPPLLGSEIGILQCIIYHSQHLVLILGKGTSDRYIIGGMIGVTGGAIGGFFGGNAASDEAKKDPIEWAKKIIPNK